MIAIVPFEQAHYAMLPVRPEQAGELERMGEARGAAAEHGPSFSAVELDEDGQLTRVLACAGLAEVSPPNHSNGGYARAWGAFADGLGPREWATVTRAIRAVVDGCGYARIDMLVSPFFDAGRRYASALGFTLDNLIYARVRGAGGSAT